MNSFSNSVISGCSVFADLSLIIADTKTYNIYMLNATGTNNGTSVIDGKMVLNYDNTVLQYGVLSVSERVAQVVNELKAGLVSCWVHKVHCEQRQVRANTTLVKKDDSIIKHILLERKYSYACQIFEKRT